MIVCIEQFYKGATNREKILLLVLTVVPVLSMCASAAVPIERNESDEIPYALAQNVFAENEELLCTICETIVLQEMILLSFLCGTRKTFLHLSFLKLSSRLMRIFKESLQLAVPASIL